MKNNKRNRAGSEAQYGPRLVGEILHDFLENSNEPLAVAYRERTTESEEHGWHPNTHLGVDVKTLLRSHVRMVVGKEYQGIFRLDSEGITDEFLCRDPHFTFIEAMPQKGGRRNPHLFNGRYISVTRRGDGSLRLNFKELPKIDGNFNLERFALGVYNEICLALGGLIEEADSE